VCLCISDMTIFAVTFRSFQGPHSHCLQTSETRRALYRKNDYIICAYTFLFSPLVLFIHAAFVLFLAVWIICTAAASLVLWFQYELSLVLMLLGQEVLEFVDLRQIGVLLYIEFLVVGQLGYVCLIFVDM